MTDFAAYEFTSPAELFFVVGYMIPRRRDEFPSMSESEWSTILGAPARELRDRLISRGILTATSSLEAIAFLCDTTVLRQRLHALGQRSDGDRSDVIERLVSLEADNSRVVRHSDLISCSENARALVRTAFGKLQAKDLGQPTQPGWKAFASFVLGSIVAGVLGNRADAAVLSGWESVREQLGKELNDGTRFPTPVVKSSGPTVHHETRWHDGELQFQVEWSTRVSCLVVRCCRRDKEHGGELRSMRGVRVRVNADSVLAVNGTTGRSGITLLELPQPASAMLLTLGVPKVSGYQTSCSLRDDVAEFRYMATAEL